MLDPKLLRNDLDLVVTQLARKGVEFDVSAYQALEAKRKSLQLETESLQNQRKDGSKSVGLLMKEGQKEAAEALKVEISGIGDQLAAIEAQFHEVQSELDRILMETRTFKTRVCLRVPMRKQTSRSLWWETNRPLILQCVIILNLAKCLPGWTLIGQHGFQVVALSRCMALLRSCIGR